MNRTKWSTGSFDTLEADKQSAGLANGKLMSNVQRDHSAELMKTVKSSGVTPYDSSRFARGWKASRP